MSCTTRTLKCGCGEFQADLTAEPLVCANCFCHSCVAISRHIEDAHGKKLNKGYTPSLNDAGGMTIAMYNLSQIKFHCYMKNSENPLDKLGMVKLGEDGVAVRYYTKCCGTMVMGAYHGKYDAIVNRLAIYESDGTEFVPKEQPINMMAKYAFEPEKVPEPRSETAPLHYLVKFSKMMIFGFFGFGKKESQINTSVDLSKAEVVPITWED